MSSEEQFEHIENKIKEATENNQIVFEEKSWDRMEALLDKDDKRRPFLWLWFLLPLALIGGYSAYYFSLNSIKRDTEKIVDNSVNKINIDKTNKPSIPSTTAQPSAIEKHVPIEQASTTAAITKAVITQQTNTNKVPQNNFYANANKNTDKKSVKYNLIIKKNIKNTLAPESTDALLQNKISSSNKAKTKTNIKNGEVTEDELAVENKTEAIKEVTPTQKTSTALETILKKDSNIVATKKVKKAGKKKTSFLSRFYILGAYGADIGSVKLLSFKNSSLSAKYGASIGYEFSKRLSLQTGFYASKKKYIAGPADYHSKEGTYLSMIDIIEVDATCLVYEIPVSIRYNILNKKSLTFYTTAGASSYIMKKEDYNYTYKRYNNIYNRAYNYSGNQHLFSTGIFSVGIEKNITKKIAFQLEPMVSIPLNGVGEGTVRLFSTSLQLGIKYNPFKK
jgi:hypothetical protein